MVKRVSDVIVEDYSRGVNDVIIESLVTSLMMSKKKLVSS